MNVKQRARIALLYRLVLTAVCCTGLYLTVFGSSESFMGSGTSLCYYTVQSNLWVLALTLVSLGFDVARLVTGKAYTAPRWLVLAHYVVMVAISVTLLVFWAMLAPTMDAAYLGTLNNLCVHTLTPLLFIGAFYLFEKGRGITRRHALLTVIPPLGYFFFALIRAEVSGTILHGGSRYPYWFIDIDRYGWFGFENGVGVFYWVLVVLALVISLGLGFGALSRALEKRAAA